MTRPSASADAAGATRTAVSAEPDAGAPARGLARVGLDRRSAVLLAGMAAALLASELAETVVATALPTIAADLGDLRLLALVTTGFLVASTAVLPAYGWLSDRFGRRRLFLLAVSVFLVGSVLGALATGPWTLVGARVVQGRAGCWCSCRPRSPCWCRCASGPPS